MKTLAELRDALKKHLEETETKLVPAAMKADATDADFDALEAANIETKRLERQIQARIESDAAVSRSAQPLSGNDTRTVPAAVKTELTSELRLGLTIKAMAVAHREHVPMAKALEDNGYGAVVKELVTTTDSKGGVTIPENLSNQVIELLRPASAFLSGNPTRITLQNGNLTIPRAETGVSGGYIAEATDIPVEEPTFGSMDLSAKKLAVIVPISNELLTWSPVDMEGFIRRDIVAGLSQKMDLALLRGDGASGNPLGITKTVGIQTYASTYVPGDAVALRIQEIETDLAKAETFMALANLPMVNRAWVMSPRTMITMSSLRDGNGNRVWPELTGPMPMLRGKRVIQSTQIPVNLGSGTNETEIYLIEFSEVWFAETPNGGMSFAVSSEAMYKVSGVAYSAYQRDVTLIRAIMHHDTDIRRLSAVVKITGVLI